MWHLFWHSVFFDPIYNGLIFIASHMPGADVGLAIVILTIIVKIVLLPLSIKAAHTQHAMRTLEPELARIKEVYKDNREEIAKRTMAAYAEAGVNPFASIVLALLQIPVVIALYMSVYGGGGVKLPLINTPLLYSFITPASHLSMLFLGFINIAAKSTVLAAIAGVAQFVYGYLSLPPAAPKAEGTPSFKDDLSRSMNLQMKYAMPLIIMFVAYSATAVVALYLVVSNLMSILQEFVVRSRIPDRHAPLPIKK